MGKEKVFKVKLMSRFWDVFMEVREYVGGNPAIILVSADLKHLDVPVAVASVNLPDLKGKEVAIKDWSENEGMYQSLLDNEIITPAHRFLSSGFIDKIPVCYLK